jgi:hypothetical protein
MIEGPKASGLYTLKLLTHQILPSGVYFYNLVRQELESSGEIFSKHNKTVIIKVN